MSRYHSRHSAISGDWPHERVSGLSRAENINSSVVKSSSLNFLSPYDGKHFHNQSSSIVFSMNWQKYRTYLRSEALRFPCSNRFNKTIFCTKTMIKELQILNPTFLSMWLNHSILHQAAEWLCWFIADRKHCKQNNFTILSITCMLIYQSLRQRLLVLSNACFHVLSCIVELLTFYELSHLFCVDYRRVNNPSCLELRVAQLVVFRSSLVYYHCGSRIIESSSVLKLAY